MNKHNFLRALSLPVVALAPLVVACGGSPRDGSGSVSGPIPVQGKVERASELQVRVVDAETGVEVGTDPETETGAGDLTTSQSEIVLKLLDDICGDTWCEGEYNWHFPKIVCRFSDAVCTLSFRVTDPNREPAEDYARWCKVHDLRTFDDLVQTAANGYQSLNDDFYDNVSTCVEQIEHDLRQQ